MAKLLFRLQAEIKSKSQLFFNLERFYIMCSWTRGDLCAFFLGFFLLFITIRLFNFQQFVFHSFPKTIFGLENGHLTTTWWLTLCKPLVKVARQGGGGIFPCWRKERWSMDYMHAFCAFARQLRTELSRFQFHLVRFKAVVTDVYDMHIAQDRTVIKCHQLHSKFRVVSTEKFLSWKIKINLSQLWKYCFI